MTAHAHDGPVLALCFDAGMLYSCGADGQVNAWEIATGARATLAGHRDVVVSLACAGGILWRLSRGELVGRDSTLSLDVELHRLIVRGDRLYAVGDRTAVRWRIVDGVATEDRRWGLPDGPTCDATVDDARLVVVKHARDVHVMPLEGGATRCWQGGGFHAESSRRRFVRFDGTSRLWVVGTGTYVAFPVDPDSGKRRDEKAWRDVHEVHMMTASAGPCEIDASGRYLAILHTGEDIEIHDLVAGHVQFAATIDPRVSDDKVLAALSQVPRLERAEDSLRATEWLPPPAFADRVRALAVSSAAGRIALGHANGSIVVVDTVRGSIVELGRQAAVTLAEPSIEATWSLPEIVAAWRDSDDVNLIAGGRTITVDASAGTMVRGVALEGLNPEVSVYDCKGTGDELHAYMASAVTVWRRQDGCRLRTIEIDCVSALVAGFAFGFDHDHGTETTMPLVCRDLTTGARTTWTFSPPSNIAPDRVVNWVQMRNLGERLVVELHDRGAWFYDARARAIGTRLPFDPDFAAVDASGRIAVFESSDCDGWGLFDLESESVLVRHTKGDRGRLTPLDHDVESGRVALVDGRNRRVVVWERDGTLVTELPGFAGVRHGFFARGGRRLVVTDEHVVRLYVI